MSATSSVQPFSFNPPHEYSNGATAMEVKVDVRLNGIEEKLRDLGPKLARKALRRAVGKVGDMWVSEMKAKVPVESGDLRDSINKKVTTSKKGNAGSATVSVGPMWDSKSRSPGDSSQQPAVYGMILEFGSKKMTAKPWMRPVFDATANKAVQLLADTLKEDLEDVVKSN
jgi:HK97 gp10 family phage protein